MSECYIDVEANAKCACDNCEWTGWGANLEMITDIQERLSPGSPVPAGQCPACGALAYLETPPEWSAEARAENLRWLVQRMRAIQKASAAGKWSKAEVERSLQDWIERADNTAGGHIDVSPPTQSQRSEAAAERRQLGIES